MPSAPPLSEVHVGIDVRIESARRYETRMHHHLVDLRTMDAIRLAPMDSLLARMQPAAAFEELPNVRRLQQRTAIVRRQLTFLVVVGQHRRMGVRVEHESRIDSMRIDEQRMDDNVNDDHGADGRPCDAPRCDGVKPGWVGFLYVRIFC